MRKAEQPAVDFGGSPCKVLSRIFCLEGKSILKNLLEPRSGEKKLFGAFLGGGPGVCSPGKF